jgi:DDE superfamily endonuclease
VLQYHFNWKTLSAVAGITFWNFYFRLFAGAIRSPQVIEFLGHLLRHLGGKLLIVWDGLPAHRSRAVWEFVRQQRGRIWLEFLPAYAPELNPTEYIWGHFEAARDGQSLSQAPGRPEHTCHPCPETDAPPSYSGDGLLATGRPFSPVTILCNSQ